MKWISARWLNINNWVKRWEVTAFVRTCWTETIKGSYKRKSFVKMLNQDVQKIYQIDVGPFHRRKYTILSVLEVHQPFYISICISTQLPTQDTTFISLSAESLSEYSSAIIRLSPLSSDFNDQWSDFNNISYTSLKYFAPHETRRQNFDTPSEYPLPWCSRYFMSSPNIQVVYMVHCVITLFLNARLQSLFQFVS